MLSRKPAYWESELSLSGVRLGDLQVTFRNVQLYGQESSRLTIDESNASSWDEILQILLVDRFEHMR